MIKKCFLLFADLPIVKNKKRRNAFLAIAAVFIATAFFHYAMDKYLQESHNAVIRGRLGIAYQMITSGRATWGEIDRGGSGLTPEQRLKMFIVGTVSKIHFGETGTAQLLDANFNYVYLEVPDVDKEKVKSLPALIKTEPDPICKADLQKLYERGRWATDFAGDLNTFFRCRNNGEKEYVVWTVLPSEYAEQKSYYLVLVLKEGEMLAPYRTLDNFFTMLEVVLLLILWSQTAFVIHTIRKSEEQ